MSGGEGVVAGILGYIFGVVVGLGVMYVAGMSPAINKCERENALTEDQMCVISAKVGSK